MGRPEGSDQLQSASGRNIGRLVSAEVNNLSILVRTLTAVDPFGDKSELKKGISGGFYLREY